MRYCSKCGSEIKEGSSFCQNCGEKINSIPSQPATNTTTSNGSTKTNGLAIAGFIISLVAAFSFGSSSLLGLILSIIGLTQINKSNDKGKGFAIAGIVISSIMLIVSILVAIAYVAFAVTDY